ncbi:hypothetical protein DXG01_015625 [Tephrocybe rancida]|nr:hypothetical protein DXG01_015625 [Tephrocybe rancida]
MTTAFDATKFVVPPGKLREHGELLDNEFFWRKHFQFLQDHGYTLRPRYRPDWRPSWLDTSKNWLHCEDGIPTVRPLLDATRADGTLVMLKAVHRINSPDEIPVGKHLSSKQLQSPKNHCVPYLDVLDPPEGSDEAFLVLPFLIKTEQAPFETIGEAVDFFRQIFEGLGFMHENNIAHEYERWLIFSLRDCKYDNLMADSKHLFDCPPHPFNNFMRRDFKKPASIITSRTIKPVKYYLIDFDLSKEYPPGGPPRLEDPPWGGDRTVPEHLLPGEPPCDPFPVDVYCLGNCIKENFLDGWESLPGKQGFEFMRELVDDMMNTDPQKRPLMSEVVPRLNAIIDGLSDRQLRSPVLDVGERLTWRQRATHWTKQFIRRVRGIPAIPRA